MKVVVIDFRKIVSCEIVDLYLLIKLGMDVKLFNGLFYYLVEYYKLDIIYIVDYSDGIYDILIYVCQDVVDLDQVVIVCDLLVQDIVIFYYWFV